MRRARPWVHVALILACLVVTAPLVFAAIKATQTRAQVLSPSLLPGAALWDNLRTVWQTARLGVFMGNSLIVAVAVTAGKTVFSLLAGMALVYFRFPGRRLVFGFILLTLMMPTEVLAIGLFDLVSLPPPPSWAALWAYLRDPAAVVLEPVRYGLGWSSGRAALIVPFLASATGVFLFRQHFMNVPRSLADAAKIDGAGPLRFLVSVLIPLSWNTIGALAVVQFIYVWDQYLWPRIIVRREQDQVVQVGLNLLIGTGEGTQWGAVMAGALLTILPPLLVFLLLQEQLTRGFALGNEK